MARGASSSAVRCGGRRARAGAAPLLAVALLAHALSPAPARAAFYWGFGTLSSTPSICFVGTALTAAPQWVAQIRATIREFEEAANIRFEDLGTCPPPIVLGETTSYPGDIRIALFPGSGRSWIEAVPGPGCPIGFVNSSFGREPAFLAGDRPCLYNLKLGNDSDPGGTPWRNHLLHEVGHSLGLAHEHERPDALGASCAPKAASCPPAADPPNDVVCMTPYDRDSVMNYQDEDCGIDGNYGHSGLSAWDRLGLHILYPQDARVAELVGNKVASTQDSFQLASTWALRGALLPAVAGPLAWHVGGAALGAGASVDFSRPAGAHSLTLSYTDFLGRSFFRATTVRSLAPAQHAGTMALAATLVPEPGALPLGAVAVLSLAALKLRRSPPN